MRLVVLGRDGVINRRLAGGVRAPAEWQALPESLAAVARLCQAHFHVVVVHNEPAVGEGAMDGADLLDVHAHMLDELTAAGGRLDAIFYCPHRADEGCACRLPESGLLLELQRRLEIDLSGVALVSDSLEGVQAALKLKMRPMLLMSGVVADLDEEALRALVGVEIHDDLAAAVSALLAPQEIH
jgi:D-glycero-D-manno-heptose 1,7-bisphosphate phosphatase